MKNLLKNLIPPAIRQKLTPRQLNALCIGAPKSGTTSIASLFSSRYRYGHESERKEHVEIIFSHYLGKITDKQYVNYLIKRDNRLWLDIESNCFLGYRADLVYKAFPLAKYILTIREPKSWLESIFDNNINFPISQSITMQRWHTFFFKPEKYTYSDKDSILEEYLLYPIDAYLNYWVTSNNLVINSIPKQQLLVLSTRSISDSLPTLADFLDLPVKTLNNKKTRANVTESKHRILDKLDPYYVNERVETVCGNFIEKYSF